MAIRDIQAFAHLTAEDIDSLGHELDRIRTDIEKARGPRDAAYIRRVIIFQRGLETAARLILLCGGRYRGARLAGTAMLAGSKIIEMMEAGHNISHGQWDWMNDPEIHSACWERDFAGPSSHWKRAHNHIHHTYTNVYGMDADLGFVVLRMTRDEPWRPIQSTGARRGLRTALAATASEQGNASGSGRGLQRWIAAFTGERGQR